MAFDGNGNFILPGYPSFPAVTGQQIKAYDYNTVIQSLAAGLSACLTRDGQSPATADLLMGGKKHTAVAEATARDQYARVAEVQDGKYTYLTPVGGTANAITATAPVSMTAYKAGQCFHLNVQATNTGPTTININGIGVVSIKRPAATTLQAGDLQAGTILPIIHDGTQFQIVNVPSSGTDLSAYALKDGSNSTGTWAISISGNAATATAASQAHTIVDGAVSSAAKIAANVVTNAKLARAGTAGQLLYSGGGASDPYWGNPPAAGVTTFNSRTGAVSLTSTDVTNALGYTPPTSAPPMTALVDCVRVTGTDYLRFTRANGSTFDVSVQNVITGGGG